MKRSKSLMALILLLAMTTTLKAWTEPAGCDWSDACRGVSVDPDTNVYVTGFFTCTLNIGTISLAGPPGKNIYVAKYFSDGTLDWATIFCSAADDAGTDLVWHPVGNRLYVTGFFSGTIAFDTTYVSAGQTDIFLLCLDATTGAVIWTEVAGGSQPDFGFGIDVNSAGDPTITGCFTNMALFGGGTDTLRSTGVSDTELFVASYNSGSALNWAVSDGSDLNDAGRSIVIRNDQAIVTGYIGSTADFDGITLTTAGGLDIVVARYSSAGTVVWARSNGGVDDDTGQGITASPSGRLHVTGYFETSVIWDIAPPPDITLVSYGDKDIFLMELRWDGSCRRVQQAGGPDEDIGTDVTTIGPLVYTTGHITGTSTFPGYGSTGLGLGIQDVFLGRSRIVDGVFTHVLVEGSVGYDGGRSVDRVGFCPAVGGLFTGPATLFGDTPSWWAMEDAFVSLACVFPGPPGPVTSIVYLAEQDAVDISFVSDGVEVQGYRVYQSISPYPQEDMWELLVELPPTATHYLVTDVSGGPNLFFRVTIVY